MTEPYVKTCETQFEKEEQHAGEPMYLLSDVKEQAEDMDAFMDMALDFSESKRQTLWMRIICWLFAQHLIQSHPTPGYRAELGDTSATRRQRPVTGTVETSETQTQTTGVRPDQSRALVDNYTAEAFDDYINNFVGSAKRQRLS